MLMINQVIHREEIETMYNPAGLIVYTINLMGGYLKPAREDRTFVRWSEHMDGLVISMEIDEEEDRDR